MVEVEKDEREAAAVAPRAGELAADEVVKGPWLEAGERVAPRPVGEVAGDLSDVQERQWSSASRAPRSPCRSSTRPSARSSAGDLRLAQAEALALAGVVRCELSRVAPVFERGDERRQRAELPQAAEPGERRCTALAERLFDALDGEIPRRCPQDPDARPAYGPGRLECSGFSSPTRWNPAGGGAGLDPGSTRLRRRFALNRGGSNVSVVSMRELLEAGVHFGHQTRRWNPKMRRFIFTERGGIYIIDLQQTLALLEQAHAFARNIAERGGSVLFVGTKKQAQDAVAEQAARVGMPYVNHRWLGGLLTNWRTISERLERLHELRRRKDEGQLELLPPKERIAMVGELEKLETNLGGVADMKRLPDAVFVVDLKKEQLAIREARRLGLPVIGLVDTNCDPDDADYVIPGNDDAIRSCGLIVKVLADGIAAGKNVVTEAEISRTNGRVEEPVGAPDVEAEVAPPAPEEAPTEAAPAPELQTEPADDPAPELPEAAADADDVVGEPPAADAVETAEPEEDPA